MESELIIFSRKMVNGVVLLGESPRWEELESQLGGIVVGGQINLEGILVHLVDGTADEGGNLFKVSASEHCIKLFK